MPAPEHPWPALEYSACRESLDALHMQTQVVGKVKLALTRPAPQWQQVPLWVNARGLTTGLLRAGDVGLEIAFDLVGHRLAITTTDGRSDGFDLVARPLRDFTAEVMKALGRLGISVTINPMTVEVPHPVRCDTYAGCDAYDPAVTFRFFRVLSQVATVFEDFRARFWGKQPPVSFFWGTFDLAVARFNLVPVPPGPGMDRIYRVAMDSQLAELGFWPGDVRYPKPAFYAFTFPKPEGLASARIRPATAGWNAEMGEFLLDYDQVRASPDPRASILEFAESSYAAGADLAGWDRTLLDRSPPP
jgi:hypothetical protein